MSMQVEMTGLRQMRRAVSKLETRLKRKTLRRALRKGARPIRDAARSNAPRRTSYPKRKEGKPLHKTIVVRSARKRRGHDELSVKVTHTREGAHGHLVEYGTGPRYKKDGTYVGVMPAQPYMRPALDQNEGVAVRAARDELAKELRVMRLL